MRKLATMGKERETRREIEVKKDISIPISGVEEDSSVMTLLLICSVAVAMGREVLGVLEIDLWSLLGKLG